MKSTRILSLVVLATLLSISLAASAQSGLAVRPANGGTFVPFDVPGAGTLSSQGTIPHAMNESGTVTGFFVDQHFLNHGFVISLDGTIATFDAPGAGTGFGQGTLAYGISPDGTIVGWFWDSTNVRHGFVRAPDGSFLDRRSSSTP